MSSLRGARLEYGPVRVCLALVGDDVTAEALVNKQTLPRGEKKFGSEDLPWPPPFLPTLRPSSHLSCRVLPGLQTIPTNDLLEAGG